MRSFAFAATSELAGAPHAAINQRIFPATLSRSRLSLS